MGVATQPVIEVPLGSVILGCMEEDVEPSEVSGEGLYPTCCSKLQQLPMLRALHPNVLVPHLPLYRFFLFLVLTFSFHPFLL